MANPLLLTSAATVASFLGVDVLNPRSTDWMILDNSTNAIFIIPDTVLAFEYKADTRVSDFPVQRGSFASYNNVQMPFGIRMSLVCSGLNFFQSAAQAVGLNVGGQSFMNKPDFLDSLTTMLDGVDLFKIVTPDQTYSNCKLEHYDYRRQSQQGATMIVVDAWFREIRQVDITQASVNGLPSISSFSPSASNPVNNGIVQTFPLNTNPASIGVFE